MSQKNQNVRGTWQKHFKTTNNKVVHVITYIKGILLQIISKLIDV